jgi:hypothetical protein
VEPAPNRRDVPPNPFDVGELPCAVERHAHARAGANLGTGPAVPFASREMRPGWILRPAASAAGAVMNPSTNTWSSWSTQTRVTVVVALSLALTLVAWLNLSR